MSSDWTSNWDARTNDSQLREARELTVILDIRAEDIGSYMTELEGQSEPAILIALETLDRIGSSYKRFEELQEEEPEKLEELTYVVEEKWPDILKVVEEGRESELVRERLQNAAANGYEGLKYMMGYLR